MRVLPVQGGLWALEVGGDRLVFTAGEVTGNVYTRAW
jgi:hypothetical protein